jgi:uncharacterized cupredoxin-like copper-binding protein
MRRTIILIPLLLALAIGLAACGGGASGPSTSLKVTMTDFQFSPSSFSVPAGQQISATITNNGATTHSFVIMQAGHEVKDHFTDADKAYIYWAEPQVLPGQTIKTSFTAPSQPGDYQVLCDIAGHFEAGMVAKLNVVK